MYQNVLQAYKAWSGQPGTVDNSLMTCAFIIYIFENNINDVSQTILLYRNENSKTLLKIIFWDIYFWENIKKNHLYNDYNENNHHFNFK